MINELKALNSKLIKIEETISASPADKLLTTG